MMNSIKLKNKINTLLINSKNSTTSHSQRLLLNLSDKINLKKVINMLLYQILACTIYMEKYKVLYKDNKFKISAPTWSQKFELPDG